ncbi:MAG: OadG family protein [Brotaphodocola sp.]
MKQKLKRALLVLCMVASFFTLSACSGAADSKEAETVDAQTSAYLCQVNESLLQQIVSFDEAAAITVQEQLTKEKSTALAGGVGSWINVMKDTGAFDSIISSEAGISEDGEYYCTTMAHFENRNVEFKVFWNIGAQNMEPISISIAPEYTLGENMSKAAMNTLLGMGTVFAVLIFISLLIYCFKFINAFENKMKAKAEPAAPAPAAAPKAAPVAVDEEDEELVDDLELVAVITAAIAAATNSSADGLVVRSIKRAPGAKWKRA